jgi:hypothetical protein
MNDYNYCLVDHINSILNITVNKKKIFQKSIIVFAPESNTSMSQIYFEYLQSRFSKNNIVAILETKSESPKGEIGILTDKKTKSLYVNKTVKKLNKKRMSFSSQFFTNSLKDKQNNIKYTSDEMKQILCTQLSKFERIYIPNKDPDKHGSVKYSGKGSNSKDDIAIALMLNWYAIDKFKTDDKYKKFRC